MKFLHRHKHLRRILLALVIAAACMIFINIDALSRPPYQKTLELDEPDTAVMNAAGQIAVIDGMGSRVTLLTPDKEVSKVLSYHPFSKNSPLYCTSIAMDDNRLYLLDHNLSQNFTSAEGEKVMVYTLAGNFEKTLIESKTINTDEKNWQINQIAAKDGKVFATLKDAANPSAVVVGDITDGTLKILHQFSCDGEESYKINYQPEVDRTIVMTYQGNVHIWEGENDRTAEVFSLCQYSAISSENPLISSLYGIQTIWVALEVNDNHLLSFEKGHETTILADTNAIEFNYSGDSLIFSDPDAHSFTTLNLQSGKKDTRSSLAYTSKANMRCVLIWSLACISILILLLLLTDFVIILIKNRRKNKALKINEKIEQPLSTVKLYGPFFAALIFIFGVTALMFSAFSYNNIVIVKQALPLDAAYALRATAPGGFGNSIKAIRGSKSYDSEEYYDVMTAVNGICMTGVPAEGGIDLHCMVYRFVEGSDNLMVVSDPLYGNRIGTILNKEEQKQKGFDAFIESAKNNKLKQGIYTYNNETQIVMVSSPLRDKAGNLIGMAIPFYNQTKVLSEVRKSILNCFLQILTLLSGLTMLAAELVYLRKILALQKIRRKDELTKTTIIEADRPINIVTKLPGAIFTLFCTLFAVSITKNAGMEGSIFIALPVTVNSLCFALFRTIYTPIVKYNFKKYMFIAIGAVSLGGIMVLLTLQLNHYYLYLAACAFLGAGVGALVTSGEAIQLSGKKPSPPYRLMVYSSLESAIASAIGVSISSVIRSFWGDIAVMIFVSIIPLCLIPLNFWFIGDDLSVKKETCKKPKERRPYSVKRSSLKDSLQFFLRPKMITLLVLIGLPLVFLGGFKSYVLPLITTLEGFPDVLIGFITLLVQLTGIFLVPQLNKIRQSQNKKDITWVIGGMGLIALLMLLFGLVPNMRMFTILLIFITIFDSISSAISKEIYIEEAMLCGQSSNTVSSVHYAIGGLGTFFKSAVLGYMLVLGLPVFAYNWAVICGVVALLGLVINKKSIRKKEKQ